MAALTFAYDHARDPMNPDDLSDKIAAALNIAAVPVVDIDPTSIVVTDPNVTEANRAAIQSVIGAYVLDPVRAKTGGGIAGRLAYQAQQAVQANIDALALPDPTANNTAFNQLASPTQAQTLAQVKALTNQNNALIAQVRALTRQNTVLIRLALGLTDSTAGTQAAAAKPT